MHVQMLIVTALQVWKSMVFEKTACHDTLKERETITEAICDIPSGLLNKLLRARISSSKENPSSDVQKSNERLHFPRILVFHVLLFLVVNYQ